MLCILNIGTVPMLFILYVGTVPTLCILNVGTVPTFSHSLEGEEDERWYVCNLFCDPRIHESISVWSGNYNMHSPSIWHIIMVKWLCWSNHLNAKFWRKKFDLILLMSCSKNRNKPLKTEHLMIEWKELKISNGNFHHNYKTVHKCQDRTKKNRPIPHQVIILPLVWTPRRISYRVVP